MATTIYRCSLDAGTQDGVWNYGTLYVQTGGIYGQAEFTALQSGAAIPRGAIIQRAVLSTSVSGPPGTANLRVELIGPSQGGLHVGDITTGPSGLSTLLLFNGSVDSMGNPVQINLSSGPFTTMYQSGFYDIGASFVGLNFSTTSGTTLAIESDEATVELTWVLSPQARGAGRASQLRACFDRPCYWGRTLTE